MLLSIVICNIGVSVAATYPQKQFKAGSPTRKGVAQEDAEPGQQDDDFELVGDHTPCLYDTQRSLKLLYGRGCNGLKNTCRVISICSCSCWANKTGELLQACCTRVCLNSSCQDQEPKKIAVGSMLTQAGQGRDMLTTLIQ